MNPAVVIGGGPAGLTAAEVMAEAGLPVVVVDQKPSLGRKFLMAGKSGLNLTKAERPRSFAAAFSDETLAPMLRYFGPVQVQTWAQGLGQPVFTGSSGRVFPTAMKASPLLRAWLHRLSSQGVETRLRWRWAGWDGNGLRFDTPQGTQILEPSVTVLAMGGASWAKLGSDGVWTKALAGHAQLLPFKPVNMGFNIHWSDHMTRHFGAAIKNVGFRIGDASVRGEAVISVNGIEGGGVYAVSRQVRDGAPLVLDLLPDLDTGVIVARLSRPRGKTSVSNFLRKAVRLDPVKLALLQEFARPLPPEPDALAAQLKALTIPHNGPRPMDEAISTSGGIAFASLDDTLMLMSKPGTFVAGEMLDWDAPTGGYLLTGCFATGRWAGQHAAKWAQAVADL